MGCIHFRAIVLIFELMNVVLIFALMNVYIAENTRKHVELGDVALSGDKVFIL